MKTIYALFAVALCIAVAGSCKKDSAPPTASSTPIKNADNANGGMTALNPETDPEEILYNNTLNAVAWGLLDLRSNTTFRTVLNAEIAKKFDGDDNVLLKTLDSVLLTQNINLAQALTASLNVHGKQNLVQYVQGAINGFAYKGDTVYPQVYIPFVSEVNLLGQPTICPNYDGDCDIPGLRVNATTTQVELVTVNEAMAHSGLTWVVSVNEIVDNTGKRAKFKRMVGDGTTRTSAPGAHLYDLDLSEIRITQDKECWPNGRNEVSYIAVFREGNPTCSGTEVVKAESFCQVSDADLNTWYHLPSTFITALGVSYPKIITISPFKNSAGVTEYWNQFSDFDLGILFYEKDVRDKFKQTVNITPGCSAGNQDFISKEAPYGIAYPQFGHYPSIEPSTNTYDYAFTDGTFRLRGNSGD